MFASATLYNLLFSMSSKQILSLNITIWSSLMLLVYNIVNLNCFSLSSYASCLSTVTLLVALLWILFNISFLQWDRWACAQYSRSGLIKDLYRSILVSSLGIIFLLNMNHYRYRIHSQSTFVWPDSVGFCLKRSVVENV